MKESADSSKDENAREGGLEAPTRHPIPWRDEEYYEQHAIDEELARVFEICHGCRRCVSLCGAFPTLFDLIDESSTFEVDGVARSDYSKVVAQCYLCDLCYQTKCPYVPPHEWNVDFPHLMLRAKAAEFRQGKVGFFRKQLTKTTGIGKLASIPVVSEGVNRANRSPMMRTLSSRILGIHPKAELPVFHRHAVTARKQVKTVKHSSPGPKNDGRTRGRVAVFVTCYGNYNTPEIVVDLVAVLRHNQIEVRLVERERCCGMPKLEIGDLTSVDVFKQTNLPILSDLVNSGWDLMAAIPSCVLMFRQEIPLMYPEDADVQTVRRAIFDPFEYLIYRHRAGLLNMDFRSPLGRVVYHAPCHQRVQNIGPKTKEFLALIPGTELSLIERCSGHDGTYGVRNETYDASMKIGKGVFRRAEEFDATVVTSDCPMASARIAHGMTETKPAQHPISLVRKAYGI